MLLKRLLLIVSIPAIILFLVIVYFLANQSFETKSASLISNQATQNLIDSKLAESAQNIVPGEKSGLGLPVNLKIPKINVDAAVEYVGLTAEGAMGVPEGPLNVAWFNQGPRPGEIGSAVISGHEGWKDGIAAVFDSLYKLNKGDKLYIEDKNGIITTFIVRELRVYDQNGDAANVFGPSDGKAHLNLITCEGTWNSAQKSYSKRLVVFTDKE